MVRYWFFICNDYKFFYRKLNYSNGGIYYNFNFIIIFTKPVVKKFLIKDEDTVVTNVYSIIGKKAIVTKDINPTLGVGQIKVEGQDWSAKCDSDAIIEKGTEVEILDINGVKAVVTPIVDKVIK